MTSNSVLLDIITTKDSSFFSKNNFYNSNKCHLKDPYYSPIRYSLSSANIQSTLKSIPTSSPFLLSRDLATLNGNNGTMNMYRQFINDRLLLSDDTKGYPVCQNERDDFYRHHHHVSNENDENGHRERVKLGGDSTIKYFPVTQTQTNLPPKKSYPGYNVSRLSGTEPGLVSCSIDNINNSTSSSMIRKATANYIPTYLPEDDNYAFSVGSQTLKDLTSPAFHSDPNNQALVEENYDVSKAFLAEISSPIWNNGGMYDLNNSTVLHTPPDSSHIPRGKIAENNNERVSPRYHDLTKLNGAGNDFFARNNTNAKYDYLTPPPNFLGHMETSSSFDFDLYESVGASKPNSRALFNNHFYENNFTPAVQVNNEESRHPKENAFKSRLENFSANLNGYQNSLSSSISNFDDSNSNHFDAPEKLPAIPALLMPNKKGIAQQRKGKFKNKCKKNVVTDTCREVPTPIYGVTNNNTEYINKCHDRNYNVHGIELVFIWDLDETLIIYNSLLSQTYASKNFKDPQHGLYLGLNMEELLYNLADSRFFYNELEQCNHVNINDISADELGEELVNYDFENDGFTHNVSITDSPTKRGTYNHEPDMGDLGSQNNGSPTFNTKSINIANVDWVKKLAMRYRKIKVTYDAHKVDLEGLLGNESLNSLNHLSGEINIYTENWITIAKQCLSQICAKKGYVNVITGSSQLIPTISKILLFNLGTYFDIDNIYSSAKIGKDNCFERIYNRFGKKCTYIAVGDGTEESEAAKQMNFPFWKISTLSDLLSLKQALELDLL
ncbi:unnamed protein product [Gordionus sp. m RMFG-2023]